MRAAASTCRAAVLAVPLLLAGCAGDVAGTTPQPGGSTTRAATSTASAGARPGDPCDLVPRAQLERALGAALGTPRSSERGAVRSCDYLVAAGSDISLQLRLQLRSTAAEFAAGRRSVRVARRADDVPGLGEEAYAADLPAGGRLVVARRGERQLLVSTTGAAVTRDRVLAIARLALPALVALPG